MVEGGIPRRPEQKRHRAVSPDEIHLLGGKGAASPEGTKGNDGKWLAGQFLKLLEGFQRHVILAVVEVAVGAGVGTMFGDLQACDRIGGEGLQRQSPRKERKASGPKRKEARSHGAEDSELSFCALSLARIFLYSRCLMAAAVRSNFDQRTQLPPKALRMHFQTT